MKEIIPIILLHHNEVDYLKQCVDSIFENTISHLSNASSTICLRLLIAEISSGEKIALLAT